MNSSRIISGSDAVQRMFERGISEKKVRQVLDAGNVIEDYSAEMPEPSRLILGFQGKRPFHVVTSENIESNEVTVITVYVPDAEKWRKDFRSRR
ncbi:MAG: DUF4258 domain-containing protein [Chloroflexi bacterium]|nr:DUF4258 domain-containing protein [Chloroflexota bacterium]